MSYHSKPCSACNFKLYVKETERKAQREIRERETKKETMVRTKNTKILREETNKEEQNTTNKFVVTLIYAN